MLGRGRGGRLLNVSRDCGRGGVSHEGDSGIQNLHISGAGVSLRVSGGEGDTRLGREVGGHGSPAEKLPRGNELKY